MLRTKCIRTGGDPRRVPATFEQLVGPYWSGRDPNADTRILVDLTKRDGVSGVAKTLIDSALDRFQEPNLWTFSPEDAVGLHTHFGACAVRGIPAGRPRHAPSHVVVMCYRGFAHRDQTASRLLIANRPLLPAAHSPDLIGRFPGPVRLSGPCYIRQTRNASRKENADGAALTLQVDGRARAIEVDDPAMPLLYALRDELELSNPRFGCGLGQCGACTVHVDGRAVRSCTMPVSAAARGQITTLAGLGTPENPHPLQTAWIEEQVSQCAYCINGWIMTAAALLEESRSRPTTRSNPRSPI